MVNLLTVDKQQDEADKENGNCVLVVMYPGENAVLWLNIIEVVLGCFWSIKGQGLRALSHTWALVKNLNLHKIMTLF